MASDEAALVDGAKIVTIASRVEFDHQAKQAERSRDE